MFVTLPWAGWFGSSPQRAFAGWFLGPQYDTTPCIVRANVNDGVLPVVVRSGVHGVDTDEGTKEVVVGC